MTAPVESSLPIEVLLVEDDPGDVLMTQEAFEEHKVRNKLSVVSDGQEARPCTNVPGSRPAGRGPGASGQPPSAGASRRRHHVIRRP